MFTDTVGYTAATQANEARTLAMLREQEGLLRPIVTAHFGREIKSTGDGFLVEFDSALKATQCAVDIQRRMHERNAQAGRIPLQIRIGIHLGDVEQHGTDIFGDAVNIAARIEPMAEPGGICVSGAVHEQVRNKITDTLEKLPSMSLKGVQHPVEIYRVVLPWTARESPPGAQVPRRLAVLPLANISSDPKDEYFADGLTEELITVLSQLRELRVIARTSVSQYKSAAKSVSQIGGELGVDAVLEGSVRKAGDDLRITVQLIDVGTQEHTWAKTYDRKLDNVFAVQAEISKQVANALQVEFRTFARTSREGPAPVRTDSYLAYLKGRTFRVQGTTEGLAMAKEQFRLAISLDPQNAAAYAGLADVTRSLGQTASLGLPRIEWDEEGRQLVKRALELDPNLPEAHRSLAIILWDDFEIAAAQQEFQRSLSINPSDPLTQRLCAGLLLEQGQPEEALVHLRLAEGADPKGPAVLNDLVALLAWLGRRDEASVLLERLRELAPDSELYRGAWCWFALEGPDRAEAMRATAAWIDTQPDSRWKEGTRAWYWIMFGEEERGRAHLQLEESRPEIPQLAWAMGLLYGQLGELDSCFRWLNRAVDLHIVAVSIFRYFSRTKAVRNDPRFQLILHRMNLA